MQLAAIDIGSNAVRLLIKEISFYKDGSMDFTKLNLIRIPLRLGFDVFENGEISDLKIKKLIETMHAFNSILKVYDVHAVKIVATSAMRDAKNANEIVEKVVIETGLQIKIITGSEEAQIIYESHLSEKFDSKTNYLYIDVGGGSTELTYYTKEKNVIKKSFDIGTIRLLKDKVDDESWDEMKNFIKTNIKNAQPIQAVGSGGNINSVYDHLKKKSSKSLSADLLKEFYKELQSKSITERIHQYGFKQDRADVIVPALQIYNNVLRWAAIDEIFVPQIGLADGLIKQIVKEMSFSSMMGLQKK